MITSSNGIPIIRRVVFHRSLVRTIQHDSSKNAAAAELKEESFAIEWAKAKPFNEIPGPGIISMIKDTIPGGKFYKKPFSVMVEAYRKAHGDIVKFPGILGKKDLIMTFDPKAFELIFRTEGLWPKRPEILTLNNYRKKVRVDIYKGNGGLLSEDDETWGAFRSKVNPIMMMPKTVKRYVPSVDEVALDLISIMKQIREPNNEMPGNFGKLLNRWALESIGTIGLDKRLGVLGLDTKPEAEHFINRVRDFMELTYQLEVTPSLWHYFETPMYKKLMRVFDDITDYIVKHVDEAIKEQKLSDTDSQHEESVLQKLLKLDRHAAIVMVSDMLFAGVDTTSSYATGVLYQLAVNPDKQEKLREEVMKILPSKDTRLTIDALANAPYLRACLKEALRLNAVTIGNARVAGQDLVIGGYKIPKGTEISLAHVQVQMEEVNFEQSQKFIPERWLKTKAAECPVKSAKETNPFVYLPFGFGPRMCVGRRFAELEVEVLVLRLLRNFKLGWNYGELEYNVGVVNSPVTPLKFTVTDI